MAIPTFIQDIINRGKEALKPKPNVRAIDVIREIPSATAQVGKDIIQGITRSGGTVGTTLMGQEELKIDTTAPKWQQGMQKAIFGEEPVESLQKRIAENELKIQDISNRYNVPLPKKSALPISIVGTTLSVGLDFAGAGGEKNAIKALARTKNITEVSKILKDVNVAEDLIPAMAKRIADTSDETLIKKALDNASEIQKTTKLVTKEARPTAEAIVKQAEIVPPKIKKPLTLERLGLKERPIKITKAEDVLLRQRIRDEARGARAGFKGGARVTKEDLLTKFRQQKSTINEIQQTVTQYIKDKLPLQVRGKYIAALKNAITKKGQYRIFSRVDVEAEKISRANIISEIKKTSVPASNLSVDYQKRVNDLMLGVDLTKPTQQTIKKLTSLKEFLSTNQEMLNFHPELISRVERLSKKNVAQITTDELTELRDVLGRLQKFGKLKMLLKNKYNERQRKINLDKLLQSTNNIDPKLTGNERVDRLVAETKRIYMDTVQAPRVADMIDGFRGFKGENAKFTKNIANKETMAKQNTQTIVSSALDDMNRIGIKSLSKEQQIKMMINIRMREGAIEQAKILMEKYGYKEIPILSEQESSVIEILKKYTNQYGDEIGVLYEEINNQPFNKLKEYVLPIKYEREFNVLPDEAINPSRLRTTRTFAGFTKERQRGIERLPRTDILGIFEEAIGEQQWYINIQPELENIKHLVFTDEYLKKGGDLAVNYWRDYLDIVSRRGWSANANASFALRQIRKNLSVSVLGYKLSSILMQPFAIFDAIAYTQSKFGTMASAEIVKEFLKSWVNPRYAQLIISKSPTLQQRRGGELALAEIAEETKKMDSLFNNLIKSSMSLLQEADVRTAAGVQQGLENIIKKRGIDNAQEEAEFLMNLVSGSSEIAHRPLVLGRGEMARMWFTFQTFFLNRWGLIVSDLIQGGVMQPGWQKKLNSLIGLGVIVAGNIAEQHARDAIQEFSTGEEKKMKTSDLELALTTIPSNIPYFGSLIESMNYGADADPPAIRTVENVFKGIKGMGGAKEETRIKGFLKTAESVSALGGIPGTAQTFDIIQRLAVPSEISTKPTTAEEIAGKYKIKSKNDEVVKKIKKKYNIK